MDTTQLRNTFRAEFFDAVEPYLVSDALVYAYIDEAQKKFCRLTEGIEDGRSFSLAVAPGTEWYALDKSILKLRKAVDTATGRPVEVVAQEKADAYGVRFDGRPGVLKAFVSGIEKGMLRAWPMPQTNVTVALETFRLSLTVEKGDELEIDEQHHLPLLMWVKHKAYGIHDSEVYDARKSAEYETEFVAYCAEAKKEQTRARHSAGSVVYGGL